MLFAFVGDSSPLSFYSIMPCLLCVTALVRYWSLAKYLRGQIKSIFILFMSTEDSSKLRETPDSEFMTLPFCKHNGVLEAFQPLPEPVSPSRQVHKIPFLRPSGRRHCHSTTLASSQQHGPHQHQDPQCCIHKSKQYHQLLSTYIAPQCNVQVNQSQCSRSWEGMLLRATDLNR